MNRRVFLGVFIGILITGCGGEASHGPKTVGPLQGSTLPGDPTVDTSIVTVPETSALDALEVDFGKTFEGTEHDLATMLIGPRSVGEYQLVAMAVDDPNGTGKIDGRWYPPRLVGDCMGLKVDTAPMPSASASFVPGDPDIRLGNDRFEGAKAAMTSPHTVTIAVQVFDDATQRDAFAATTEEFYSSGETMGCAIIGEMKTVSAYDIGYPAYAVAGRFLVTPAALTQYRIGDRVLMTAGVQLGLMRKDGANDEVDASIAYAAIDAEVTRLKKLGFG
jgi:hypothetical protein